MSLSSNRFYDFKNRYGRPNKNNGKVPKSTWLTPEEKGKIREFHRLNPLNGYRRLCYMMLDEDIVACSPKSVYRVLKDAGLLDKSTAKDSKKGEGFNQPSRVHEHWHIDISYLNICGTFYYMFSILDGYSRMIVGYDIREKMTETDVEQIIQKTLEKFPEAKPRIISDNGPQFIAGDFKTFIKFSGMTHVRTSPYYPESNGKIERWHREMKQTIRPKAPQSLEDARRIVGQFVETYCYRRLHSAIGYVTPFDRYLGIDVALVNGRKTKQIKAKRAREKYWIEVDSGKKLSPNGVVQSTIAASRKEKISPANVHKATVN